MSEGVFITGASGTGKSYCCHSLLNGKDDEKRNNFLYICPTNKRFSFRPIGWTKFDGKNGNIFVSNNVGRAIKAMQWAAENGRKVIIIDDFQYFPVTQYMEKALEKGYDKYSRIAKDTYDLVMSATQLPDDVRVYIMGHSDTNDLGQTHMKTIGKMIDNTVCLEGLVSIVLRTHVVNGQYKLSTRNDGNDTVKAPFGMFDGIADQNGLIDNDLALIDKTICEFYGI